MGRGRKGGEEEEGWGRGRKGSGGGGRVGEGRKGGGGGGRVGEGEEGRNGVGEERKRRVDVECRWGQREKSTGDCSPSLLLTKCSNPIGT